MQRIGRPTVRDAAYTGTRHPNRLWTFAKTPKGLAAFGSAGLLVVASTVMAAVLWSQDATISSASQDSDISFLDGGGGVLGFATVSIGSSGASASISLTGIAGAADFQVTDLLQIQNSDLSQAYSITLIRSADPTPPSTTSSSRSWTASPSSRPTTPPTRPKAAPSRSRPARRTTSA